MPAGLLESDLFGHERGAFYRRQRAAVGRFELADKARCFCWMKWATCRWATAKLLRVLRKQSLNSRRQ